MDKPETHNIPLKSTLPDMKFDPGSYIHLQPLYKMQAEKEKQVFCTRPSTTASWIRLSRRPICCRFSGVRHRVFDRYKTVFGTCMQSALASVVGDVYIHSGHTRIPT